MTARLQRLRWLRRRLINRYRYRRRYGPAINVEPLLDDHRRLNGSFKGVHLIFPGTLKFGDHADSDPPETFYPGDGFAMEDCLITMTRSARAQMKVGWLQ